MVKKVSWIMSIVVASLFSASAATVSGTVTDNADPAIPVAGAVVTLTSANIGAPVTYTDTTDAQGDYSLLNVAAGNYTITAAKSGYTARTNVFVSVASATSAVTRDLVLVPREAGVAISGTVTASGSTTPVAGAQVYLRQQGDNIDSAVTSATGAYSIDSVQAGNYSLVTSATGYTTLTTNNVVVLATALTRNIQLVAIVVSTLRGKITGDSATGPALVGAMVTINRRNGNVYTDTTTTDANGWYEFTGLEATVSYRVGASLAGYGDAQSNNTQAAGLDTVNLVLTKVVMGTLRGKITSDSAAGPALAGALVIVSRQGTAVDSATSDANGWYEIANLQATVQYSINASMTGYTTRTLNNTQAVGADTLNIALTKIATGSLYVVVLARSDSTAIAGASVTVSRQGSTALTGTSNAAGYVSFETIVTGTYTISVTAGGYSAGTATQMVAANVKDTANVYLTASATGTKTLKGTVTDSATGAALANVRVQLTLTGGGGTALTIIDSTDATGAFSFAGIPVNRATGTVAATKTGYLNRTLNNVAIGTNGTADTTTRNFKMLAVTAVLPSVSATNNTKPAIRLSGAYLQLRNINESGVVSMISANGKLVFRTAIAAHAGSVALPRSGIAAGPYLITIVQKSGVISRQIMMP